MPEYRKQDLHLPLTAYTEWFIYYIWPLMTLAVEAPQNNSSHFELLLHHLILTVFEFHTGQIGVLVVKFRSFEKLLEKLFVENLINIL